MPWIKKIIGICVMLGIAVGIFFGVRFLQNKYSRGTDNQAVNDQVFRENEFKNALQAVAATDKDFDGLTDEEEGRYNTNPEDSDSDGDGLGDKEEILVYKTNPLDKDTDKDGYADGYEVRRGFSPLGSGRL
jgi:hypothetical protein